MGELVIWCVAAGVQDRLFGELTNDRWVFDLLVAGDEAHFGDDFRRFGVVAYEGE